MNTTITPFAYGEHLIRTMDRDGTPWFVASDVCSALGLENTSHAVDRLDSDEKGITNSDTLGGTQKVIIINEPGLYRLLFKSRKAEAKAFQRWVYHEVLPAIRRTGSFGDPHRVFSGFVAELIAMGVSPDLAVRAGLKLTPAAAPEPPRKELSAAPPVQLDQEFLARFEDGRGYNPQEVAAMLPEEHPARLASVSRSECLRLVDLTLAPYFAAGKIERVNHRRIVGYYRKPDIVPFSAAD
jgi:hypothetical protein